MYKFSAIVRQHWAGHLDLDIPGLLPHLRLLARQVRGVRLQEGLGGEVR